MVIARSIIAVVRADCVISCLICQSGNIPECFFQVNIETPCPVFSLHFFFSLLGCTPPHQIIYAFGSVRLAQKKKEEKRLESLPKYEAVKKLPSFF